MSSDAKSPLGFVHLRFENEDLEPVLYVYEIQIEEAGRRKGLGKFLMQLMEMVAWTNNMHKIMLTVIKANKSAYNFYHDKMGYATDDSDPTMCEPLEEFGYEILCKINPRILKKLREAEQAREGEAAFLKAAIARQQMQMQMQQMQVQQPKPSCCSAAGGFSKAKASQDAKQ